MLIRQENSPAALKGFTLLELMVVIAILAILMALALPSFQSMLERWRVRTVSENLYSTLLLARSEAGLRNGGITVQAACSGSNWQCGWSVSHSDAGTLRDVDSQNKLVIEATANEVGFGSNGVPNVTNFAFLVRTEEDAAASICSRAMKVRIQGLNILTEKGVC